MPHKLLLADDSVTIQRVIELTFADEDVQVIAVGDGRQAIARVQSDRPDIVLADVGMPERDGYEVASFVKGTPELSHIPVLLLTGAFEPIDENRARAAGCDGVLVKPFEPQMVISRVRDLLAGRKPSGLWGSPAAGETPARPQALPAAGAEARPASPPVPGGSLEDYFDRLDAAFASIEAAPAQPPVEPPKQPAGFAAPIQTPAAASPPVRADDVLAGWDPDLKGDPLRPAAVAPPLGLMAGGGPEPHAPAPPPVRDTPPALAPEVREPPPPQREPPPPPPAAPQREEPPPPQRSMPSLAEAFAALLSAEQGRTIAPPTVRVDAIAPELVDEIVHRAVARLSEQDFRQTILDVAEKMVREEIDRIKATK